MVSIEKLISQVSYCYKNPNQLRPKGTRHHVRWSKKYDSTGKISWSIEQINDRYLTFTRFIARFFSIVAEEVFSKTVPKKTTAFFTESEGVFVMIAIFSRICSAICSVGAYRSIIPNFFLKEKFPEYKYWKISIAFTYKNLSQTLSYYQYKI